MKTLSVRQPWASLLCSGVKDVENRTWAPPTELIGKKILIHSGASKVRENFFDTIPFEWCSEISNATRYGWIPSNDNAPLGKIIGFATLAGYSKFTESLWDGGEDQVKWIFTDPYVFDEPIPAKGKLGLFDYPLEENSLPAFHKAIQLQPHLDGTEAVFPVADTLLDELDAMDGPIYDVTANNVKEFFDLEASDEEYVPRTVKTIRLISPLRERRIQVRRVETFPQTWDDTGEPIFYTSLGGEDYVKLLMCFVLKR